MSKLQLATAFAVTWFMITAGLAAVFVHHACPQERAALPCECSRFGAERACCATCGCCEVAK